MSTWAELLSNYPGLLRIHLPMINCFGAKLSYGEPTDALILGKNLLLALVNIKIIDKKLHEDLVLR